MKAHDLAKKLLAGHNHPVIISIACPKDTVSSTDEDGDPIDELTVGPGTYRPDLIWIEAHIDGSFGWDD